MDDTEPQTNGGRVQLAGRIRQKEEPLTLQRQRQKGVLL